VTSKGAHPSRRSPEGHRRTVEDFQPRARQLTPAALGGLVSDSAASPEPHTPSVAHADRRRLLPLTLTALGVVYGDIGTSPL
jgi:hypothetical protein